MGLDHFFSTVLSQYGSHITQLAGGNLNGARVQFGNTPLSATSGQDITVNKNWWRHASESEKKGVLVHELTHVATRNQGLGGDKPGLAWADNPAETVADAVRYSLLGGKGINSTSLGDAKHYAREEGWTNMGQQGPGLPGLGSHGGRMRNTFANLLSKNQVDYQNKGGAAALPAMDPASTANYYSQLGGLYAGYQNQLIGLKQQRVGIKAGFGEAKASIRSQLISGLADTQNAAIDRGVGGSSAALQQEAGVRGDAAAATATAKRQELEQIGQTRLQGQQAGIDYFQGAQQLEAQKLAQQQSQLAQQLQSNLIVSGQETQMDALRAMYRAQMQAFQTQGGNGNGGPGGNAPQGFDIQAWQAQQARQAGYGNDVGAYLRNIWASRTGA